ncbi:MAG: DEAD/DEAH box helicase family protein [Actinobacteria bacterium]|nr:DEAD/DEAH box helicase family protein [Actinomycetota bacterium]
MQEALEHPTIPSEEAGRLSADALRAERWAGEPFLRPDEDPAVALAEGRARRRALDDALAEMDAGKRAPSAAWKVHYALMLGLERVITDHPPRLASGTELRRHQIDALAGMLTELIARHETELQNGNGNGNGNGTAPLDDAALIEEEAALDEEVEEVEEEELPDGEIRPPDDPGSVRRFRFRHPTASGKTIAAGGFVEAARTMGVLILTHRRLLVKQFESDLTAEGYGARFHPAITRPEDPLRSNPITIQTYAWFARHVHSLNPNAYQLVICDEAHTALGEKTSAAIRAFTDPIYIGMTATEQLIAKQVSDVFPASVDDLPLGDAARRGLIAPLRCLRVPPAAAISSVPIVGGDYEQEALAKVLDHALINQAAASLYRDRFDDTAGIVYAAGVEHAYNLAREFRAAGLKAEAVSGRTPPLKLAETLAAYERGEINVLINAQLLAEGWNSPRATVCMHLAPTASRRVYQQRIGRIMRIHPRKEAGVVVDFVDPAATHTDRTITLHTLLGADFYRPGARVTPAPRRRVQRRARRKLSPAAWLVPVTPDPRRRVAVITREWERVDPSRLADDEQQLWAAIAGRQLRFDERQQFAEKLARASRECREAFLMSCAAENPNRRLRLSAVGDRLSSRVDRASFDDLVSLVTGSPTWEKDRVQGVRILLRGLGEDKVDAPPDILPRWTWRLARATRKLQDRRASAELPEAKRLLGALTNSRGHRHEENAARLVNVALEQPIHVAVALLASAEAYTPTAQQLLDRARERLGTNAEIANALADNLPAPKQPSSKSRRRRRKKKGRGADARAAATNGGSSAGEAVASPPPDSGANGDSAAAPEAAPAAPGSD